MNEPLYPLGERCSNHFIYRDLIECGQTWHRLQDTPAGAASPLLPTQPQTWEAIAKLAGAILDPVMEHFQALKLTYGYAGPSLTKHIPARIAPRLDQHAGYELGRTGNLICPRGGMAVDFQVPGYSSLEVARWIGQHLPFDRMYIYSAQRPLHVSFGPAHTRQVVAMLPGKGNQKMPRVLKSLDNVEKVFGLQPR